MIFPFSTLTIIPMKNAITVLFGADYISLVIRYAACFALRFLRKRYFFLRKQVNLSFFLLSLTIKNISSQKVGGG